MTLAKLVFWRLLAGIGVLWGAATLTFLCLNLTSGDVAIAILGGPDALPTPEVLAQVRKDYGLDQPLIVQYGHYLARLAGGDLGESYRLRIPVVDAIRPLVGHTISEVAGNVGFGDLSYFTRSFRRRFEMTPSEARELARRENGTAL